MATKSGTKSPKKTLKRIDFGVDEFPGCCGIEVVARFKEEEGVYTYPGGYWGNPKWRAARNHHSSVEEQIDDLYNRILEHTSCPCVLITLVSRFEHNDQGYKAGEAQLPLLHEKLIAEDWQINQVFINPEHGDNEVTLYTKTFPERQESRGNFVEDDNWNEDEE